MMPTLRGLSKLHHLHRAMRRDQSGVAAIEFAFVGPVFLLFIFSILEIALIVLFSSLLNDGTAEVADYLRDETMQCMRQGTAGQTNVNCSAANPAGVRQAACRAISVGGMSCDASRLKIAIYSADNPVANPVPTTVMIDEISPDLDASRSYVIALGYEWGFTLPTSKMLLPTLGDRVQIQARVYSTTAERALR